MSHLLHSVTRKLWRLGEEPIVSALALCGDGRAVGLGGSWGPAERGCVQLGTLLALQPPWLCLCRPCPSCASISDKLARDGRSEGHDQHPGVVYPLLLGGCRLKALESGGISWRLCCRQVLRKRTPTGDLSLRIIKGRALVHQGL